jgi:uncharacterized protein (DUF1501 family)
MTLNLPRERLDDRRELLEGLDRARREFDRAWTHEAVDQFRAQAFEVILGGIGDAFDLKKEDPKTVARYDTGHLVRPASWEHKNNKKNYTAHAGTLGKLLLLARRLCERGCGFVTISTSFVWDMHADKNNLGVKEGMDYVGAPFDHAVSAFIEDVEARGLSEKILLVCTGEMGRTPRINKNGGRDHWGNLTPLMLHGGGITSGQVIGQSTKDGGQPATEPYQSKHLISTLMHTLFDVGELRNTPGVPTEVLKLIVDGEPIRELV